MTPIDRVRAHFDSLGKRRIEIPEWQTTIYCTPITISERTAINSGLGENDTHGALVRTLIYKAKDESGAPLFTIADEPALLQRADSAIIIRVASEIYGTTAPKAAELGNS